MYHVEHDGEEIRLMGTEEQVQTAKGLIEDFVSQKTSGLPCLKNSFYAILLSFHMSQCIERLLFLAL